MDFSVGITIGHEDFSADISVNVCGYECYGMNEDICALYYK